MQICKYDIVYVYTHHIHAQTHTHIHTQHTQMYTQTQTQFKLFEVLKTMGYLESKVDNVFIIQWNR